MKPPLQSTPKTLASQDRDDRLSSGSLPQPSQTLRIAVVGGAGHVGLPLALLLAQKGFPVAVIDTDAHKIDQLKQGRFPFLEEGGAELLAAVRASSVVFTTTHAAVADAQVILLTVETPIDEYLNPDLRSLFRVIEELKPLLRNGQVLLLRSTVCPGTSERIHRLLQEAGLDVSVSYCPERIAQGNALKELQMLPQIISASDARGLAISRQVCGAFAPHLLELGLKEAELAKLFSNAWRYIKFAVANQFYMLAEEKGLDFAAIRRAMMANYARAADFPSAGFAAGPCLLKDTMQLVAFSRQRFQLGYAAMLVNETLPEFLVERVKQRMPVSGVRVGILGMAFKADSDDTRESLSYKLRKLLLAEGAIVMCTDPFVQDPGFFPLETVLASCRLLFIGVPHSCYRGLPLGDREVVDCWQFVVPSP